MSLPGPLTPGLRDLCSTSRASFINLSDQHNFYYWPYIFTQIAYYVIICWYTSTRGLDEVIVSVLVSETRKVVYSNIMFVTTEPSNKALQYTILLISHTPAIKEM